MIRFDNYNFAYECNEKEQGIHGIDLEIKQGEFVLLCGESGCGKTTIIRSVNGIASHLMKGSSSGKVYVNGIDVSESEMYKLSDVVASVFQNPKSQFFNTDVESEIVYTLENRGVDIGVIEERLNLAMKDLKLERLAGRSMFELSGGEKQQVAIAGGYIAGTPVVALDEPTANLDPDAILKIRGILEKMKALGKTVLIAEHRLSWLKGLSDRVIYMKEGRIEKDMDAELFFGMSEEERKSLGLRELSFESEKGLKPDLHPDNYEKRKLLEVNDLTLAYKKHIVQENLNLYVREGEILGITGVNGAGKTTLLRALAGLSKKQKGAVILDGKKSTRKSRRKRFGMVMQDVNYQLFADSCENECMLGNPLVNSEEAASLLNEAMLSGLNERHPQSLSGGQKQRLALAVCKASDKEILLLDEPTSGLDYKSMLAVKDTLRKLSANGKAIIIVTHDKEFLSLICDRVQKLRKI